MAEPFVYFRRRVLDNLHHNVTFAPEGVWRLTNVPKDGSAPLPSETRALGIAAIRKVLAAADAHDAQTGDVLGLRAIGAR